MDIRHHAGSLAAGHGQNGQSGQEAAARKRRIRRWDPRWAEDARRRGGLDDDTKVDEEEDVAKERGVGRESVSAYVNESRNEDGQGRFRWREKPSQNRRPSSLLRVGNIR